MARDHIHDVLERWRAAERQRDAAVPGSPSYDLAVLRYAELAAEYQGAYHVVVATFVGNIAERGVGVTVLGDVEAVLLTRGAAGPRVSG